MQEPVYLDEDKLLIIETPFEAPQYPLDGGWWRFLVTTRGDEPELVGELQIKNAGSRFDFLASWLSDISGYPVNRKDNFAIARALLLADSSLGMVKRT